MDCINHSGTAATAFCQSCGKPLCPACVRTLAGAEVFCPNCQPAWQAYPVPGTPMPAMGGPNPTVAGALGIIPGVGAMYNGQFLKGLLHVVIFAVLISLADHFEIFGLFIGFWVLYQIFDAYQTAKAIRYGMPMPDPLGLNQLLETLRPGGTPNRAEAGIPVPPPAASNPNQGFPAGEPLYPPPPMPCTPFCGGRVPVSAIVLILLGVFFLLGQLDILHGRIVEFFWPVLLIVLGIWLIVRRITESQGGPQ